jgi:hypothetical protein
MIDNEGNIMKHSKIIIYLSLLIISVSAAAASRLLPNPYPVYTKDNVVVNHPAPEFIEKLLPVDNSYDQDPGCYIACYSHSPEGVYPISSTIFVEGLVRVKGKYDFKTCNADDYQGSNAHQKLVDLCNHSIFNCKKTELETGEGCWGSGETGGFLGL